MPLHFSSKDFEILDLDPPNNPTSHYGACHFGYNLALKGGVADFEVILAILWQKIELKLKRDYNQNGTHPSGMWGC